MTGFPGSYRPEDVTFLMRRVEMATTGIAEKERLIQSGGRHYSEMLSREEAPDAAQMHAYREAMARNGAKLAGHVNLIAGRLAERARGRPLALCSLARAGTPIGILVARAMRAGGAAVEHYSMSIVRDRGLDQAALGYVRRRHAASDIAFLDGWTGKGAIAGELRGPRGSRAGGVEPHLAVVCDPCACADLAATHEDYAIPSGILNGVVSGLVSRSVMAAGHDAATLHGCVGLDHLEGHDVSREFVDAIDGLARDLPAAAGPDDDPESLDTRRADCARALSLIGRRLGIDDPNRIKPGVAEATRALLRRSATMLLAGPDLDGETAHLVDLARRRGIAIEPLGAVAWKAVAIIGKVGE